MTVMAGTIKGSITDKQTREPLTGATVQIVGTTQGAIADMDGNYSLNVTNGIYTLSIKYVGYKDIVVNNVKSGKADVVLNFELESDAQALGEVSVVARKNLEGERALQMERRKATLAIENIGSKEMSIKGISNVEEGVKKITGISIADAGQLIVRGLGDRYSTTTLNGLPIASPNPDNKLIPLDLFPSSTIQNITVSKVYNAEAFADYSGAHIDISTKENIAEDFFSISFNTGGKFNTLGKDRYQMNRNGSLFKTSGVDQAALDMPLSDFDNYVKTGNIFDTSFAVKKKSALPDFNGNLGFGKNISIDSQTLSILASVSAGNGYQNMDNAFYKTLEATGNVQDNFSYDSYAQELKLAALGYIGYTLRRHDRIGYTFFYTRNATDTYQRREGTDAEDHELTGSNNITHIYTLQNHQLNGLHNFGEQASPPPAYRGGHPAAQPGRWRWVPAHKRLLHGGRGGGRVSNPAAALQTQTGKMAILPAGNPPMRQTAAAYSAGHSRWPHAPPPAPDRKTLHQTAGQAGRAPAEQTVPAVVKLSWINLHFAYQRQGWADYWQSRWNPAPNCFFDFERSTRIWHAAPTNRTRPRTAIPARPARKLPRAPRRKPQTPPQTAAVAAAPRARTTAAKRSDALP